MPSKSAEQQWPFKKRRVLVGSCCFQEKCMSFVCVWFCFCFHDLYFFCLSKAEESQQDSTKGTRWSRCEDAMARLLQIPPVRRCCMFFQFFWQCMQTSPKRAPLGSQMGSLSWRSHHHYQEIGGCKQVTCRKPESKQKVLTSVECARGCASAKMAKLRNLERFLFVAQYAQ